MSVVVKTKNPEISLCRFSCCCRLCLRSLITQVANIHVLGINLHQRQVSHDHRSLERNLSNCEQKPEKVRTSMGFEPVTS